jgi:hypothetical protein
MAVRGERNSNETVRLDHIGNAAIEALDHAIQAGFVQLEKGMRIGSGLAVSELNEHPARGFDRTKHGRLVDVFMARMAALAAMVISGTAHSSAMRSASFENRYGANDSVAQTRLGGA